MNAIHGRTISVPKPQKQSGWKRFRKNFRVHKYYYLLMLPGIIALLVFRYVPMAGIVIAFKNFRIADGIFGSEWVGLKWFEMLFSNAEFTNVLFNTIYISILKIVFSFPAPILLALMINEVGHLKYKKVVQTTVYLPHFISWVVVGGIMMTILSPSVGVLSLFGAAKSAFGTGKFPVAGCHFGYLEGGWLGNRRISGGHYQHQPGSIRSSHCGRGHKIPENMEYYPSGYFGNHRHYADSSHGFHFERGI